MNRSFVIGITIAILLVSAMITPFDSLTTSVEAGGTTYWPRPWNGYKVYLSPAQHSPENIGCDNYEESPNARAIASKVKDYLYARNYIVRIGNDDFVGNMSDSNDWGSTIHIPIHSNAGTWDCSSTNSANGGTWMMYRPGDQNGSDLSRDLYYQMRSDSPGTNDRVGTDESLAGKTLYELRAATMPAAYVEAAFHTYGHDENWLRDSRNVGDRIGLGIHAYFNYPVCGVSIFCQDDIDPSAINTNTIESTSVDMPDTDDFVKSEEDNFQELQLLIEGLLQGPPDTRHTENLASWFTQDTMGMLNNVAITPEGVTIIDFVDFSHTIPNASTSAGTRELFVQMNNTVFQFDEVEAVIYEFDGSCRAFYN